MTRVALVPNFYLPAVHDTSGVRMCWQLAEGLLRNGVQVGMMLPSTESGRYTLDRDNMKAVIRSGDVKEIVVEVENRKYEETVVTDGMRKLVDALLWEYPVDAVIMFGPQRRINLQRVLEIRQPLQPFVVQVPIIPWADDIGVSSRGHINSETEGLVNLMGAVVGPTFFSTQHDLNEFLKYSRDWFSMAKTKKLMEQSRLTRFAIDLEKFYRIGQEREGQRREGRKGVVLGYGGQFTGKKNVPFMVECFEKAMATGRDVKMIAATWWELNKVPESIRHKHVDLRTSVPCGNYDVFREADVALCVSEDEGAGSGWLEMLASGLLMIYWDRPWWKGMIPEGYPFVAKSLPEVQQMFFWVLDNFEKAKEMVSRCDVRGHLNVNYSFEAVGKRFKDETEKLISRPKVTGWISEGIGKHKDSWPSEFDLKEGCELLGRLSENGIKFGRGGVSAAFARNALLGSGYIDVGDSQNIRFRRAE